MVHRAVVHGAMIHAAMLHIRIADRCALPLRDGMAHRAVALGFRFATGLGRSRGRHMAAMPRMVLRQNGRGNTGQG